MTEENAVKLFSKHYKSDVEILQTRGLKATDPFFLQSEYRIKIAGRGIAEFIGKQRIRPAIKTPHLIAKQNRILKNNGIVSREARLHRRIDKSTGHYLPDFYWHKRHFITTQIIKPSEKTSAKQLDAIIEMLTDIHAEYFNRENAAHKLRLAIIDEQNYARAKRTIRKNWAKLEKHNAKLLSLAEQRRFIDFIDHIDERRQRIPRSHRSLTHNRLSPDKIIFAKQPYIIDWQYASYQCPEHDLVEILHYFTQDLSDGEISAAINHYREQLRHKSGYYLPRDDFEMIMVFNLYEFAVNRQAIQRLEATKSERAKVEQRFENIVRILNIIKK